MHEYAFDVQIAAIVRIRAESEKEARALMGQILNCVHLRVDPDEAPEWTDFMIPEASIDDAERPHLLEVDGKEVDR